jgi:Protein of unknown function (DUF1580)
MFMSGGSSDFITLPEVARRFSRPVAASTPHRWAINGVSGVRLKTIRVGGVRYTTHAWVSDFFETLNLQPVNTRS